MNLTGEARAIYKAMNRLEKKFYKTSPLCSVRRDKIVKKFAVLSAKFEALMERPGLTYLTPRR